MDRFTWGVVGGAIALVVAGLVAVLLVERVAEPPDLSTPAGTVRAYMAALDDRRPEDAWELLGEAQRRETPRDEFIRRASGAYPGGRDGRVTVTATENDGTSARVSVTRTYNSGNGFFGLFGPSSYSNESIARLERQSGAWRITVPPRDYLLRSRIEPPAVVVTATVSPSPPAGQSGQSVPATVTPGR